MTEEKLFPPSKPQSNVEPTARATDTKTNVFNPSRPTAYRPPPPPAQYLYPRGNNNHHHRRRQWPSGRRLCCCCCFWSILILLIVTLIAAVAAVGLYILYHPKPPSFSVPSLRIHRLNLTTNADSSSSHLSSVFNLTLISLNPNPQFTFSYDPFAVSIFTGSQTSVFLGNGTVPAFMTGEKNQTSFRAVVVTSSEARELDAEEVTGLRSDLRRKNGLDLKILMDTKVEIKMGKLKSKRVGIRVSCDGIKGTVPRGKVPSMAATDKSKCKVDLRIKIWNWTF